MHGTGSVLAAIVALALSGCLGVMDGDGDEDAGPAATAGAHDTLHAFELRAADCVEGGGHSVYNMEGRSFLPEPWVPADVSDDVGHPMVTTYGTPAMGPLTGIYHTTALCASFELAGEVGEAIQFGFVGVRVEPPEFDPGGASRHYLLDVFSAGNDAMREGLAAGGGHVTSGAGTFEWLAPGVLMTQLDDDDHGTYTSHLQMEEAGAKESGVTRLWLLHEGDDGKFHPMAIDLVDEGGTHLTGYGSLSHLGTGDHPPLPGAAGNVAGLAYEGFTRTVMLGPHVDAALDESWQH